MDVAEILCPLAGLLPRDANSTGPEAMMLTGAMAVLGIVKLERGRLSEALLPVSCPFALHFWHASVAV